jgi:hypothetical protein
MKLLEKIADPQGGLLIHARLFPKGKDDHPTEVDRTTPVEDHAPEFKAKHFASLTGAPFAQCMDTITKFAREFEEVVAMDDRGDSAYREAVNRVKYSITRLINGVTDAELDHYLVPVTDVLAFKQDVLEGPQDESREDYQTLRRPALAFGGVGDAYFEDVNATLKNKAATEITSHVKHDADSRKITGYTTPKGCDYKVKRATLRKAGDANNLTDMTVTTKFGDKIDLTPKISGPKLPRSYIIKSEVVMGLSRKARERLLERIGSNEQNMKALGGLVAVVETVNLVNSLQAVMNNRNDDLRGELFADLISSFGDLAGAMENLIDDGGKSVADDVAKGAFKVRVANDIAKQAQLARKIQVLRIMAHVGSAIDIGVTLKSLIENFRQNDDAYIGDSVMLAGFALTAVGATAAAAPLAALVGLSAAWVTGIGLLLLLIGYMLKRFVFPEDTSFEIWLVNGPFACGKHTHPHFSYHREEEIIYLKDSGGQSLPKACTVHHYGPSKLIVDSDGNLVDGTFSDMHVNNKTKAYIFKCDQKGQVYLKAGRHPDIKTDTFIGTLGQPYTPHPVLQTGTDPGDERFDGHTPGKDPGQRVCMNPFDPLGIVLQDLTGAKKRHRFAIWCEMPKEAYRALMDALYRPVVTSRTMRLKTGVEEVWLHIHMPFLLPKSEVYLEFWAKKTVKEWGGEKTLPAIEYTLDSKTCGGHQSTLKEKEVRTKELKNRLKDPHGLALSSPHALFLAAHRMEHPSTLKELADGPNRFTIRLENHHYLECRIKVRIDLYGDHEVCLPWEPLFCGGDIGADTNGHRWVEVEKAFLFNPSRQNG